MKKIIVILTIALLLAVGCVMEPPTTFYTFKIINNTKAVLFIESKQDRFTELRYDTIKQKQELLIEIPQFSCYKDYNDTLIHSFFRILKIIPIEGELQIDPYNKTYWVDSIVLIGSGNCRGGSVYYTLIVKDSDIK